MERGPVGGPMSVFGVAVAVVQVALLTGCCWEPLVKDSDKCLRDRDEYLYGVTTVSRPLSVPGEEIEDAFDIEAQSVTFEAAMGEAAKPQSGAYRRYQVDQAARL